MRGRPPRKALIEAALIAGLRGIFQQADRGPERLYDFIIAAVFPLAFVKVRFAERIFESAEELANEFQKDIRKLRMIAQDPSISPELWLRSRYGKWRFFRVVADRLIELDRDGKILSLKPGEEVCAG